MQESDIPFLFSMREGIRGILCKPTEAHAEEHLPMDLPSERPVTWSFVEGVAADLIRVDANAEIIV